jgi:hypothetical protein
LSSRKERARGDCTSIDEANGVTQKLDSMLEKTSVVGAQEPSEMETKTYE